jgi:hypothetical protein
MEEMRKYYYILKNSVLWDIAPCNLLKVERLFGGICRLHLQGRRVSQIRNQHEAGSKQSNPPAEGSSLIL